MHNATYLHDIAIGLGCYYLLLCAMNWLASLLLWRKRVVTYFRVAGVVPFTNALLWLLVGTPVLILGALAMMGLPPSLPNSVKQAVNLLANPITLTVGPPIALTILFLGRRFFTKPMVAWSGLNLCLLAIGLSMTDPTFAAIVRRPDNIPTFALLLLLAFFAWRWGYRAVRNDEQMRRGLVPFELRNDVTTPAWRRVVNTELFCVLALVATLALRGVALEAPLEALDNSVETPNPSKAPWYLLGLQELLVYFDPWYAGVGLPIAVLVGSLVIPAIALCLVVRRLMAIYTWRVGKDGPVTTGH